MAVLSGVDRSKMPSKEVAGPGRSFQVNDQNPAGNISASEDDPKVAVAKMNPEQVQKLVQYAMSGKAGPEMQHMAQSAMQGPAAPEQPEQPQEAAPNRASAFGMGGDTAPQDSDNDAPMDGASAFMGR